MVKITLENLANIASVAVPSAILAVMLKTSPSFDPNNFSTQASMFEGGHFSQALDIAKYHHGGFSDSGEIDLDSDGMDDMYIVTRNGNMFHTMSRRLVQGEDTANVRKWYQSTPEMLQYSKKGDFKNPTEIF